MKSIVTAVHHDGAKWGWPGEPVMRLRGEDGSWAWVPELPGERHAIGDIIDDPDTGWEWLPDREREAKLAAIGRKSAADRERALVRQAEQLDKLDLPREKKTPAQLDREIAQALGVLRRRKKD